MYIHIPDRHSLLRVHFAQHWCKLLSMPLMRYYVVPVAYDLYRNDIFKKGSLQLIHTYIIHIVTYS